MRGAPRLAATTFLALLLTPTLHAHEGWGLVVDPHFGVVVSDIPGNTIWRIKGGRREALIRDVHSHELVLGKDGALYGTDPKPDGTSASVWKLDRAGRFSYVIPPSAGSPLGFQSFLITDDGTIYSANRYDHTKPQVVMLRRDRNGKIAQLGGTFTGIDGMKAAPDGSLVIADGAYLRTVTGTLGPLTRRRWGEDLLGLSTIRESIVHVADHAGRRILRVDLRTGKATAVDHSSWFWAPAGFELPYILEHLRPPLSLLGDLQIGPYLRVRRGSETIAVVWGRKTWIAALVLVFVTLGSWRFAKRRRAARLMKRRA